MGRKKVNQSVNQLTNQTYVQYIRNTPHTSDSTQHEAFDLCWLVWYELRASIGYVACLEIHGIPKSYSQ